MLFNWTCGDLLFLSQTGDKKKFRPPLTTALKERFFCDDLKWRLRQSLISRRQGLHESLDSYIELSIVLVDDLVLEKTSLLFCLTGCESKLSVKS